ncbi:olfactory receptor 51T1-like [Pleurodeles waltl]
MTVVPEGDTSVHHEELSQIPSALAVAVLAPSLAICLLTGAGWLFLLRRYRQLSRKARFLLLACTTLCHVLHFSVTLLRLSLLLAETAVPQPLCVCMLLLQNYSLFAEMAALDAMCLDRYLAVCRPLSYESVFSEENFHKPLLLVFLVPLMPPVVLGLLQVFEGSDQQSSIFCHVNSLDTSTLLAYSRLVMNLAIFLPSLAAISLFYALVLRQDLLSGIVLPSSQQARRVLLVHLIQMGFYLLPILPFILLGVLHSYGLVGELAVTKGKTTLLIFFIIGQVMGPIVHGLRSKEIRSCLIYHLRCKCQGVEVPLTI